MHVEFQLPRKLLRGWPGGRAAEKEREKMPLIVDTYFHDSARKPLGPITILMYPQSRYTGAASPVASRRILPQCGFQIYAFQNIASSNYCRFFGSYLELKCRLGNFLCFFQDGYLCPCCVQASFLNYLSESLSFHFTD